MEGSVVLFTTIVFLKENSMACKRSVVRSRIAPSKKPNKYKAYKVGTFSTYLVLNFWSHFWSHPESLIP